MTVVESPAADRFRTWTDWKGYGLFLEALQDRRVKVTYDRGRLELLSPSPLHEKTKKILDRLVFAAAEWLELPLASGGSTTFRKQILDRGLEPDECYFVRNAEAFGEDYDAEVGPPPDLALEIEVTRSSLNRMGIYQALGVPEVWRYTADHELTVEHLGPEGYRPGEASAAFPGLPVQELPRFVRLGLRKGELVAVRQLRAFLAGLDRP